MMRAHASCSRWAGAAGGALRRGGSSLHGAVGRIRVPALWHRGRNVQLAAQLSLRQRSISLLQHPSVRRLQRRRVRLRPRSIRPPSRTLSFCKLDDGSQYAMAGPCASAPYVDLRLCRALKHAQVSLYDAFRASLPSALLCSYNSAGNAGRAHVRFGAVGAGYAVDCAAEAA